MYDWDVLEELAAAIEGLDVPVDGAALVRVLALRDQLDARIADAVGAFDKAELWDIDGSTSMIAWLRASASMTKNAATRLSSLGRRLRDLPVTSAAYADGRLSGGQVASIVANLNDATVGLLAEQEAELVPYLVPLTVAGTARAMASWKSRAIEPAEPTEVERSLHLSQRWTTATCSTPRWTPRAGPRWPPPCAWPPPTRPTRPVRRPPCGPMPWSGCAGSSSTTSRPEPEDGHRPHLNVVVDLDALHEGDGGRVLGGPGLDATTVAAMLCDCALHRVVMAGRSAILDYGTSTRTIPAPLWSALVIRDEGCRFPGCDRPSTWWEGHHVRWVTHGGPTELANLVLVCTRHHHRLQQPGWQAKLLPDATFEVTQPDGIVRATSPPRRDPGW